MRNNISIAKAGLACLLTAALALAITLTFSCSSGDDNNNGGGGNGGGSSVTGGADGGGNQNAQIYKEDGTAFTGSGIIETTYYYTSDLDLEPLSAGSVTNGTVNLNLPTNIPNGYLEEFLDDEDQRSCTAYPKDIKAFKEVFVLVNNNRDFIGQIYIRYKDKLTREDIRYWYFTKDGKITCNLDEDGYKDIMNIDAKAGWNKIYARRTYADVDYPEKTAFTTEYSTDNILTKEVKWTIYTD